MTFRIHPQISEDELAAIALVLFEAKYSIEGRMKNPDTFDSAMFAAAIWNKMAEGLRGVFPTLITPAEFRLMDLVRDSAMSAGDGN